MRVSLFKSFRRSEAPPAVPRGLRVYAIGDIHGRADLLDELLEAIEADWRSKPARRRVLVFLGDLIDRGPDSRGVIQRVATLELDRAEIVCVLGNHEEVLVGLLDGHPDQFENWLRFGGQECLASYGLESTALSGLAPRQALAKMREAIPRAHRQFLRGMSDSVRIGGYLFVHAGIRPGVPIEAQRTVDLRWIRAPFLDDDTGHGFVVVHGHTISEQVEWRSNRIGVDTGAYRSGVLTALVLEDTSRRILQSAGVGAESTAKG